jgi:hypothetical protein
MALGYVTETGANSGSILELVLIGDGSSTSINIDLQDNKCQHNK